jgi:phosphoglycerol transferase MdoB-like AlkP superfamily enzyme
MTAQSQRSGQMASRFLPSRPYVFLFLVYLAGMVLFTCHRLYFLYQFRDRLEGTAFGEVVRALLVGWRFDQIIILSILLPFVIFLPWFGVGRNGTARLTVGLLTIFFSAASILLLADVRFFYYFDSHLNFQAVQYTEGGGGGTTWHFISSETMFVPLLVVWSIVAVAIFFVFRNLLRLTKNMPDRGSWVMQIVYFVVCLALLFVGIRGRTGLSTINWGVAYIGQNHFLNQLGLNGVYTLGKAFTEEENDCRLTYLPESQRYAFVDFREGLDSVRAMLNQPGDEWLQPDRSILRLTRQPERNYGFRPNVVIVLMESWSGRNTHTLGSPRSVTPHFDSLAQEGILFDRFYATGTRTNYGMPGVLCSFPSLPGRSVMTRYNAQHPFVALSELLHDRGYYNGFAYGGDLVFDNTIGFFRTKKFDRLYGDDYFGKENVFGKWGIPDHVVFHRVVGMVDSLPRPFQMTILTLSNHEPFDLPDSSVQKYFDKSDTSQMYNAQAYADLALGKFIAEFKKDPAFDSTIFVFTADHAKFRGGALALDPKDFYVPLLIYSPTLLGRKGERIEKVGGQTDILPTIMGLLGGDYTHASWGRDLLKLPPSDSGFAIMNVAERIAMMEHDYFYLEELGVASGLYDAKTIDITPRNIAGEHPEILGRMQRRLRMFMQIAEELTTPTPLMAKGAR